MSLFPAALRGQFVVIPRLAVLAGLLACGPAWADGPAGTGPGIEPGIEPGLPGTDTVLEDLLLHALGHSPELEVAYQRWRAALARVPQARALPEPQFSLGLLVDEIDRSADYMGERYALTQSLPWFGTLALRAGVAQEEAEIEARRLEAARLVLFEQVTAAWFEYAFLHQAAAIARDNLALMTRLEAVARARYRAAEAGQAEVNRAQLEMGRLDEQLRSLQDRLAPAAAELNALLGRPAHARLPVPAAPSRQPFAPLPERDAQAWLERARAFSPTLAASRHETAREAHGIELARRQYYPEFMLGVEYERGGSARMARMDGGGKDMIAGMVSVSIPLRRGRYDAGLAEARARHVAASHALAGRELELEAALQAALFEYRDSRRKLELYGGTLLPKARQALASTEAAYRTGEAGFSDLVDTQRVSFEFSLAHERAAADRARARARVLTLAGEAPATIHGDPTP